MAISTSPLADAMRRFLDGNPGYKPLADAIPVGRRPGVRSSGRPSEAVGRSGGGGSFTEADYSLREYHPAVVQTTSDGVFTFEIEPIKTVVGVGDETLTFEPPPAE